MAFPRDRPSVIKTPNAVEQLLEEINFQRTKEMRQLLKDDSGFVVLQGSSYWTDLFVRHFLFQAEHCIDGDDLLFFIRKKHVKGSSRYLPKYETEVEVYRKDSRKLPIGDPELDWEETVYLNLIIHQFDYMLTLAICTRTSPKQLQVLRRHSQKVYASPSRRRMDTKGEVEEMTYPHICFMVDNFNEVFSDILVRDGEMVCVELVASDRSGNIQTVIFLGSIRYDALKRVYDARASMSSKVAQRMMFGLFSNQATQRIEFVRMKGPQGKGYAEMAVTKPKGYGAETPTSEPGLCAIDMWDSDWDEDPEDFFVFRHQRRLSDPSANLNNFVRSGWRTKTHEMGGPGGRTRSENDGLDSMANGLAEVEAGDVRDDRWSVGLVSPHPTSSHCSCRKQCMGMQAHSETLTSPVALDTGPEAACSTVDSDEDEFHDCLSWCETDLEMGVDVSVIANIEKGESLSPKQSHIINETNSSSNCLKCSFSTNNLSTRACSTTFPSKIMKGSAPHNAQWFNRQLPSYKVASDGTVVYYWCDKPVKRASLSDTNVALDHISEIQDMVPVHRFSVIIMGDINVDCLVQDSEPMKVNDMRAQYGIEKLCLPPTRATRTSSTPIDWICTNSPQIEDGVTVLTKGLSNHKAQICLAKFQAFSTPTINSIRRHFNQCRKRRQKSVRQISTAYVVEKSTLLLHALRLLSRRQRGMQQPNSVLVSFALYEDRPESKERFVINH